MCVWTCVCISVICTFLVSFVVRVSAVEGESEEVGEVGVATPSGAQGDLVRGGGS